LNAVKKITGYGKIILNPAENSVTFKNKGMKIDLGGIAKGYAIDQAVEVLKENGITDGLVDIGGDIRCFGKPADKQHWVIALQNPDLNASEEQLLKLKLNDKAVATSGHYYRYYKVNGQTQSHIMDPQTAKGTDKLSSVTVIADEAITADVLATAIHVMGKQKGLKLLEDMKQKGTIVEAIFISPAPDYQITFSSGAENFVVD
jgi:thiamine biosynthesis lipoprotein